MAESFIYLQPVTVTPTKGKAPVGQKTTFSLLVQTEGGDFIEIPDVRFDTGAVFTQISISLAEEQGIPRPEDDAPRIPLFGATGKGSGLVGKVVFGVPERSAQGWSNYVGVVVIMCCKRISLALRTRPHMQSG